MSVTDSNRSGGAAGVLEARALSMRHVNMLAARWARGETSVKVRQGRSLSGGAL